MINPCPDHKAVVMSLDMEDRIRGKGYWKLNVSVLQEEEYRHGIHNIVRDTISELDEVVDKSTTWEILKIRVKEFAVKYCAARTSKQAGQIKQLEAKINLLDKNIKSDTLNDAINLERKNLKTQLGQLYMEKAIGKSH